MNGVPFKLDPASGLIAAYTDYGPVLCISVDGAYVDSFPFLCVKSVSDSSRCKRREEQECFRLANCRSCSLNSNCQWEPQQQECQAMPGERNRLTLPQTHTDPD